jgi:hypothetical protein
VTVIRLGGTSACYGVGVLKVKVLSMMLKIEFKKIKVVYGPIRNIKGYYIHL